MTMMEQQTHHDAPETYSPRSPSADPAHGGEAGPSVSLPRKSPALAGVLSLFPGLGQVYVGYYQQGFTNSLIVATAITLLNVGMGDLDPLVALFMTFFWLYNVIDAVRRAALYNLAARGAKEAIALPEMPRAQRHGSLLGGIVLIVAGTILFTNTRLGYSLYWLEEWWPLAAVGLGIYLIAGWARNRSTAG